MISLGFERWGFRDNPFDPKPLNKPKEYEDLFVRKEDKYSDFLLQLNKKHATFCMDGKFGIGKTTSYNAFSYFARNERKSLVLDRPIEVQDFMNSADVLSQMVERVANILEIATENKNISKNAKTKLDDIYYSATSIGKGIEKTGDFGPSFLKLGRTKIENRTQITSRSAFFDRQKYDLEILGEIAVEELNVKNICLALDELESHKIDPNKSDDIIGGLRNVFFTDNFCFCLIGDINLESRLSADKRFKGSLGLGIEINELSLNEFHDVLNRRYEFYKIGDYKSPFEDDVPERLYSISDGDIRWALQILNRVFDWMIRRDMPHRLGEEDIIEITNKELKNKYKDIREEKWKILDILARNGTIYASDENIQKQLDIKRTTLKDHLTELEENNIDLVRSEIKDRRRIFYLGPDGLVLKESRYIGA